MAEEHLTVEYVREALDYDPDTGVFTWRVRPRHHFETRCARNSWNTRYAGTRAGSPNSQGYLRIGLQGRNHRTHRLAFLLMTGSFPPDQIDHIDGDPSNNRWCNLRPATQVENGKNAKRPKDNTSGHMGVYWHERMRKWRVRIRVDGKLLHLGLWSSLPMAALVRKYSETYYGFHPNHGRS